MPGDFAVASMLTSFRPRQNPGASFSPLQNQSAYTETYIAANSPNDSRWLSPSDDVKRASTSVSS